MTFRDEKNVIRTLFFKFVKKRKFQDSDVGLGLGWNFLISKIVLGQNGSFMGWNVSFYKPAFVEVICDE